MSSVFESKAALAALGAAPETAVKLCREALATDPQNGDAELILSEALRRVGDLAEARRAAANQVKARPQWFGAHRQLAMVLVDLGAYREAVDALARAAELHPQHPTIWRDLGDNFARLGATEQAEAAYAKHAASPTFEPNLEAVARMLAGEQIAEAEAALNEHLATYANDVAALRLLSEAQARAGRSGAAEVSLRRCLELAPDFARARMALGQLLHGLGRHEEAVDVARVLVRRNPGDKKGRRLLAAAQIHSGDLDGAMKLFEEDLQRSPGQPGIWASYGNVLKAVGRADEASAAFRKSLELAPFLGDAYWGLAGLKRLTSRDRADMESALSLPQATHDDRVTIQFTLGRAFEAEGDFAEAFRHYRSGSELHRSRNAYDPNALTSMVDEVLATFTEPFFAKRAGAGAPACDPIFVVGMPRSGSTLIEQILASHSMVEGTMELPDLPRIIRDLVAATNARTYPAAAADLDAKAFAHLGERYLQFTKSRRKLARPLFVDKQLSNWSAVGFIHLILPNAKIIDARRHPMATGLSCYKQHFSQGLDFTYDLADLGRYYKDYLRAMTHWDAVLPARMHRVIHEDLAADPETHIRAMLDYCGLPFEGACLRPHETERPVMTASSEQVRQPIDGGRLDEWRNFEAWLAPLSAALGPALHGWRGDP